MTTTNQTQIPTPTCLTCGRKLKPRGIEIHYCGEGYSRNDGPRSMLGRAWRAAQEIRAAHLIGLAIGSLGSR